MANDVGSKDVSDIIYFSDMIAFDFKGKNGMTIDEVIAHLHGLRKISENLPSLLENFTRNAILKMSESVLLMLKKSNSSRF